MSLLSVELPFIWGGGGRGPQDETGPRDRETVYREIESGTELFGKRIYW